MIDKTGIKARFETLAPHLDERARRLFAATEAYAAGRGGVAAVSEATGVARSTIGRGLAELRSTASLQHRIRRPGGGRKSKAETEPGLLAALEELVQSATRGDPEAALLWVSRSQRHLAGALAERGFMVSQKLVGRLACASLASAFRPTGKPWREAHIPTGMPNLSTSIGGSNSFRLRDKRRSRWIRKKKELVGDFKNGGRELRPKGNPEPVRVHDFKIPALGKVAPYGVYDITDNSGWVNVGIDHDTAAFAVESIRRWWKALGRDRYPGSAGLLITADCGGSNGARVRLWKHELQGFANETGLAITVAHHPPGTSKWNRIEHRLFAFITQNWRGKPRVSHEVIVQLIGATTTASGLDVQCHLDENRYPKAIRISDAQMSAINIDRDPFHGEWNYTISPNLPRPMTGIENGSGNDRRP